MPHHLPFTSHFAKLSMLQFCFVSSHKTDTLRLKGDGFPLRPPMMLTVSTIHTHVLTHICGAQMTFFKTHIWSIPYLSAYFSQQPWYVNQLAEAWNLPQRPSDSPSHKCHVNYFWYHYLLRQASFINSHLLWFRIGSRKAPPSEVKLKKEKNKKPQTKPVF